MSTNPETIERGLAAFREMLRDDPALRAEFEASARQFFRADPTAIDALGERRHMEWFLLERESSHLGAIPIESLVECALDSDAALSVEDFATLQNSFASVFEVTGVEPKQGIWLSDLASLGEYPVHEPEGSTFLRKGDLIAGRIYPLGDSLYYVSSAAAFFRNPELVRALRRDLERAREGRRGVLRLRQEELESMFFAAPRTGSRDAVGEARRLLLENGVDRDEVEAILDDLAHAPTPADPLLYATDDAFGRMLDRLAFETSLDLDVARRTLLAAWKQLAAEPPGTEAPSDDAARAEQPVTRDVAAVLAEFERRRGTGAPVEPLLRELERRLALDEIPETNDDEDTPAPDFPGVVSAMITEFLWEIGNEEGPAAQRSFNDLASFGRFASDIGVFENLRARDLLVYTCYWLPESDELENADRTRQLLSALARFCEWAEEKHELPLHTEFKDTLRSLQSSLPRIIEANRRRTRDAEPSRGELFECIALSGGENERACVRDREGREHAVRLDAHLEAWLRPGDRLRGRRMPDEQLAVYCCYPPEAQAIGER